MDVDRRATLEALQHQVNRIAAGHGSFRDVRDIDPARGARQRPPEPLQPKGPHVSFGQWLLQQTGNAGGDGGLRADLIAYARADPRFPREGGPEDVRARLREVMADGDMWAALDDAELDWACW